MTGLPGAPSRTVRAEIENLLTSFGRAGLATAALRPGLLAVIDQHAAAIRDTLFGDFRPITRDLLAGYAEGIQEGAAQRGWSVPTAPVDWRSADWVLVRLLAVCAMSECIV
jgi:hypothetical protein